MLADAVAEVAKKILEVLNTQREKVVGQFVEHLNNLTNSINEVKSTIKAKAYDMDPNVPLVTPELVMLIKI